MSITGITTQLQSTQNYNFDRIINLYLDTTNLTPSSPFSIMTDPTLTIGTGLTKGIKPDIDFQLKLTPGVQVLNFFVRVTNLNLFNNPTALNVLTQKLKAANNVFAGPGYLLGLPIMVEAGYANQALTRFTGTLINAYQSTPGPDSETIFQVLYGGFGDKWTSGVFNQANSSAPNGYAPGTNLQAILSDIATQMGGTFVLQGTGSLPSIKEKLYIGGRVMKDLLKDIQDNTHIMMWIDTSKTGTGGGVIFAYTGQGQKGGNEFEIKYLSTPPYRQGPLFNFIAPWLPGLRVGDTVVVSPLYARTGFASQFYSKTNKFMVKFIDIDFSTIHGNKMTVLCISL